MADELKSNLEPVEEKDLSLEKKFVEKIGKAGEGQENAPIVPEQAPERKEGSVEKEAAYSKILAQVKTPAAPADEANVGTDAAETDRAADAESKVKKLVDLALQKGVVHAVKVARHLDDNYALDEFHDRLLADDLHAALIQKGLLKEL